MKTVFKKHFFRNPAFFLEVSRVIYKISKAVIPQQIFQNIVLESNFMQNFQFKDTDILFNEKRALERVIKSKIVNTLEYKSCNEIGLNIYPYIYFLNRILKEPRFLPNLVFFVSKGYKLSKLERFEKKALNGQYEKYKKKIIELEGKILGYPRCCINSFIESKFSDVSAETRLIIECYENGLFEDLLKAFEKSEIVPYYAFFTSNFYPCSIDCKRAKRIGKRLDKHLKEYSNAFRLRTMINLFYYLVIAYKMYKYDEKYKNLFKGLFSKIGNSWLEVFEKSERSIVNLTDFTNTFILRVLNKNQKD